jgi:hypothetical protein
MPQPPQLLLLVAVSTHAPLHSVKPSLHAKPHEPPTQAGTALATPVEHA